MGSNWVFANESSVQKMVFWKQMAGTDEIAMMALGIFILSSHTPHPPGSCTNPFLEGRRLTELTGCPILVPRGPGQRDQKMGLLLQPTFSTASTHVCLSQRLSSERARPCLHSTSPSFCMQLLVPEGLTDK